MKVLTLSLCLFPLALCAQFSKGDKYVIADFYHITTNPTNDNSGYSFAHYFSITSGAGYFIRNNLAVGIQAGYSQTHQAVPGNDLLHDAKFNSHGFSAAPFIRKYWALGDKFFFSLMAHARYARSVSKTISPDERPRTQWYALSANLSSSLAYFPTKHWSVETSIASISGGFNKTLGHDNHYNYFSLGYGSINLGIAYYFGK